MNELELTGKTVFGEVRSYFWFYFEELKFYLPERKSNKGRKPTKVRSDSKTFSTLQIQRKSKDKDWQNVEARDTDKGKLRLDIIHKKIWAHCEETDVTFSRELFITR